MSTAAGTPATSLDLSISNSAANGQTAVAKDLIQQGANVDTADARGLTPVMLAVIGGHLETAVQLALAGADLSRCDPDGRTALEYAILAGNREASLALLLIATSKFKRPLKPLLPPPMLIRLQQWVLDRAGKNDKAAAIVCQQHVLWLSEAESSPKADITQSFLGLMHLAHWGSRHGHLQLCEQVGSHFSLEAARGTGRLRKLTELVDSEGNTVLHALAVAAQSQACRDMVTALPRAEALSFLRRRNHAGVSASETAAVSTHALAATGAPPPTAADPEGGISAAAVLTSSELTRLTQQLALAEEASPPAHGLNTVGAAGAYGPAGAERGGGRGGALRRRKSGVEGNGGSQPTTPQCGPAVPPALPAALQGMGASSGLPRVGGGMLRLTGEAGSMRSAAEMDVSSGGEQSGDAVAAGDLLMQLAAGASTAGGQAAQGRSRNGQAGSRQRDAKPYQRKPGARSGRGGRDAGASTGRGQDCWLPGGFWWQDTRTAMPPGRQPGELAGWTPLAGDVSHQAAQKQKDALDMKEHFVQGLESRDDAAAYLQSLRQRHVPDVTSEDRGSSKSVLPITVSVDDSVTGRVSSYKQLASWGGFRRHFKEEAECEGGGSRDERVPPPDSSGDARRAQLRDQLLAKRAEVLATQAKLESLSLEQRELERLYTNDIAPDNAV